MAKRSKNQNTYIHGSHNELCDVCGFKYKTEDMHTRWDGLRVCHEDLEERHPMDFFRSMPDNQNVNDPDANDIDNSGVNTTLPSVTGTIADQTNFEDDTITPLDTSTAFDEGDGTNVNYTAISLPAGLDIDSTTGIITGTINSLASSSSPYTTKITLTTSASAVFSVSTSFTWTVETTGPITSINWIIGTGTPVIVGAQVSMTNDVDESAYSDDLTFTFDDGLKLYAEFLVGADYDINNSATLRMGGKSAISKTVAAVIQGVMVQQANTTGIHIFNVALTGTSSKVPTNGIAGDIVAGAVVGIAFDGVNNKAYYHVDGLWAEDASFGGDPSGNNGWAVVGVSSTVLHMQTNNSVDGDSNDTTVTYFNSGLYIPAGYTLIE